MQRQQTALHIAVETAQAELAELLLLAGADLELLEKVLIYFGLLIFLIITISYLYNADPLRKHPERRCEAQQYFKIAAPKTAIFKRSGLQNCKPECLKIASGLYF